MTTICCMCQKIIKSSGHGPIELASEKISHGYCPDCYQKMMRQFKIEVKPEGRSYKRLMHCKAA